MSSQPGEATTFAELVVIHASDHGAATGSADARGWRPAMEDAVVVSKDAVPGAVTLAIFDGHGGVDVAKAGAAALGPKLTELSKSLPPSEYLASVFPLLDFAIKEKDGAKFEAMGSTAVCVVVTSDEIACGWLGDSTARHLGAGFRYLRPQDGREHAVPLARLAGAV